MADHVTWAGVVYALIVGLPAMIAALAAIGNNRKLRTGNDKTVGEMVTEQHGVLSVEQTEYATHGPVRERGAR